MDTAKSITATLPEKLKIADDAQHDGADNDDLDILAFLSLYFANMQNIAQDIPQQILSQVFLSNRLLARGKLGGSGGSFSVSVIDSKYLNPGVLRKQPERIPQDLPEFVAVRVAKADSRYNQRILTSMAKEIAILTQKDVRPCQNIVKLLGSCWGYANAEQTILLPVLVYEAAQLGDLDAFLHTETGKNLPIGHQLQICIDITKGVELLHRIGAIHCDIKLKNILMFSTGDSYRPYRAKIADFGCAMLLDDIDSATSPPPGTRFWSPPEQSDSLLVAKEQLHRIDIFSLGLVLLAILTSNVSTNSLLYIQSQKQNRPVILRDQHVGLEYFKRWGGLAFTGIMILERYSHLTVTQRSSIKEEDDIAAYIPPELLDDETCLAYSTRWNEQATSIMFRMLQGDIAERTITAREIASQLEVINLSVGVHGQHEHRRVDLDDVAAGVGSSISVTVLLGMFSQCLFEVKESCRHGAVMMELIRNVFLEAESKEFVRKGKMLLVKEDAEGAVALPPDWMPKLLSNSQTRSNLLDILPKLSAAISTDGDTWEMELFGGTLKDYQRKALAVQKRSSGVVKLTNHLGTFSMMATPLLRFVTKALDDVSSDSRVPFKRRSIAAYELALGLIAFSLDETSIESASTIEKTLELLDFAVRHGHREAQWTVGWLYDTFGRNYASEQAGWLVKGVLAGSRIAATRLQKSSPLLYRRMRRFVQREYQGIGQGWKIPQEYLLHDPLFDSDKKIHIPKENQTVLHASTGNIVKVASLLSQGVDVNSSDGMKATALVAACRSGHADMVEFLVECGADASLVSNENISALHFLSSFDEDYIPSIASLLVAAGCPLEIHSIGHSNLNTGYTGNDRFYGLCDGPPLLWAVAANNLVAVKALISLGADPFDLSGASKSLPHSPVTWAAQMHQADILEALLGSPNLNGSLTSLLNTSYRCSVIGDRDEVLPLAGAASYSAGLAFYRIQIHGAAHRSECRKTIHLLLSSGADPSKVSTSGISAFQFAAIGQPYALQAFLEYNPNSLKQKMQLWTDSLLNAAVTDSKSTFDELLKVPVETDEKYNWPTIIAQLAGQEEARYHAKYYLNALISHHHELFPADTVDYSVAFERALYRGNHANAKIIYKRTDKIDIIVRRHEPSMEATTTLLGRLLRQAVKFSSDIAEVRLFLELTDGPEILFDDVWVLDNGTRYNALQASLGFTPFWGAPNITTAILETVLMYFKHPTNHLNKVHNEEGRHLLHMAVRYGNVHLIEVLLNVKGLEWGFRDSNGLTAFDCVLNRLEDSRRDQEIEHWGVPPENVEATRLEWDNQTRAMIYLMEAKGLPKLSTYSYVFKRISSEIVRRWIIHPKNGHIEVADYTVSAFKCGQFGEIVASIHVGRCRYLATRVDPEIALKIPGTRISEWASSGAV